MPSLSKLSRRTRIIGGTIAVLACLYLLLIAVFGRPLGIISFNTTAQSRTGVDVVSPHSGWDQLYVSDLIGLTLEQAEDKLGTPGIDNTLASDDDRGFQVVVDKGPVHARPDPTMTVVGYCVAMELADRHFLTLAVADVGDIDPALQAAIAKEPEQVAFRYMSAHKCDAESTGQFTPWLVVKPMAQR